MATDECADNDAQPPGEGDQDRPFRPDPVGHKTEQERPQDRAGLHGYRASRRQGTVDQQRAIADRGGAEIGVGQREQVVVGHESRTENALPRERSLGEQVHDLVEQLGDTSGWTLAVGLASVAALALATLLSATRVL